MTRGHKYRITVMPLAEGSTDPLVFMHENHDDLISIVERCRKSSGLDADSAAATAIGIKLLTEVMLQQRGNPLFEPLRSPVGEFIRQLKAL